mgnify:CR=1 FL=1
MTLEITEAEAAGLRRTRVAGDWRRPGDGPAFTIAWRDAEGFGQIVPRPTPEAAAAAHAVTGYYTHEPARRGGRRAVPAGWRALAHLAWRADRGRHADAAWWRATLGPAPLRIIELGAGNGGTLASLAAMGHSVTGVEPDTAARATAIAAGVPTLPGTAEDPPGDLPPGGFDVVIMAHVLEHCLDPTRALANAARLTAPGGRVVLEVPNNACRGAAMFGQCWNWLDVPRHVNFFTPPSLRAAIEAAGLTVERTEFVGYSRQFEFGWAEAQATIGRALGDPRGAQAWRYRWLFLTTAFAAPDRKYDSVRVTARRAPDTETSTTEVTR